MKKYLVLLTAMLLVLSMAACTAKEEAAAESETEETLEMITDDAQFASSLGIIVDTSKVPVHGMARYIDGDVIYCAFSVQEDETKAPCTVLFRATKNADLKDSLAGFNTEGTKLADEEHAGIKASCKEVVQDDLVYREYDFEKDGIYYCLVIDGELSDEMFESLFASFLEAVRPA